jgi:protein O-GlcNAc transferase
MMPSSTPLVANSVAATFGQAATLFQRGQLDAAEILCQQIIQVQPVHPDALHVLGLVALRKGHTEGAIALIRKSLDAAPEQPHVLCSLGHAFRDLQRPEDALASYRKALQIAPDFAGAWCSEGNALIDLHQHQDALRSFDRALALQPDYPEAHQDRGNALLNLGRPEQALESYQRALALQPELDVALNNCAYVLRQLGRTDEALKMYGRLGTLHPEDPEPLVSRGTLLLELDRYAEAIETFDGVLRTQPDNLLARVGRANACLTLRQFDRALADYGAALQLNPSRADVQCSRGYCLLGLGHDEEALASFEAALTLKPDLARAADGRGIALRGLKRFDEALAAFEQALRLSPHSIDILYRRAVLLRQLKRHEEAASAFMQVVALKPDYDYALGNLLHERLQVCDWTGYGELVATAEQSVRGGSRVCLPGVFLSASDSAAAQLDCARSFVADKHPPLRGPAVFTRYQHEKIRVAYVSGDFREHPVAHLLTGVLEKHDRRRFDTIGISLRRADHSQIGERVRNAFDQFIDVSSSSDQEVSALLRELEVDIAVDLMGYTGGSRPGLFTPRPAPVQVNFLGFPGTLGTASYDYIIADRWVIPDADANFYTEKVVHLPHSFQPNDDKRRKTESVPLRAENGLPERAFVFCCFNGHYKITPEMFDIWMSLLRSVEDSVLWLADSGDMAARNLRRVASQRGVDTGRIVFASRAPELADHLARYTLADLFLDTLPFNAHSTASDALWAGVPLLTCLGNSFASRVAASLLSAMGCPELITRSPEEYAALALRLATTPEQLRELRTKLNANRLTSPLFETALYCRHLETAYTTMWERSQRGEPPQHLSVPA